MLHFKEKLLCLLQKGFAACKALAHKCGNRITALKPLAGKTKKLILRHRVPTMVISCCLVMTMLMSVITVSIHKVDVWEDGELVNSFYTVLTNEEALLNKAEITLSADDELNITEESGVVTVEIARAFPVTIQADGNTKTVMMASGTVGKALKKAGLTCGTQDILSHDTKTAVESGMEITLDRVTGKEITETVTLDYETKRVQTNDLYVGETKVKQQGENGTEKRTYSVTYLNGEETDRELISSEVTKEPVNKIVLVGTKIKSTFKKTSSTPTNYKKAIAMTATAYAAGGTTATGRPAKWGVVAVDPNVIPLGTKVYVETTDGKYIYGTAVAADTGGAIKGNKIDICVNTRAEAYAFGRRTVNVYIL